VIWSGWSSFRPQPFFLSKARELRVELEDFVVELPCASGPWAPRNDAQIGTSLVIKNIARPVRVYALGPQAVVPG
jgi:hypothetical protein